MATRKNTPTTPALAACPFCESGSPGVEDLVGIVEHASGGAFSVTCGACGAAGPTASSAELAAARWHERAKLPVNPLVDPMSTRGTLENLAAMHAWFDWHPLDTEAGYPGDEVGYADAMIRSLVRDAVRYEARRSGA